VLISQAKSNTLIQTDCRWLRVISPVSELCSGSVEDLFQDYADVYVWESLHLYYEQGNPKAVAPDVFVVFGVARRDRFLISCGKKVIKP